MGTPTQTTVTALVMHEDRWVRSQVMATLDQEGYTVLAASNGASGMRLAEQHQPEVIVLGVALPELSGTAVLEQLQGCLATRDIPVLVVSSRAAEDTQSSSPGAGASSHSVVMRGARPAGSSHGHWPARMQPCTPARRRPSEASR